MATATATAATRISDGSEVDQATDKPVQKDANFGGQKEAADPVPAASLQPAVEVADVMPFLDLLVADEENP